MNKFILVFILIIFLLGQLNPLLEYFKSKVTSRRKFENDALRHFNHLFIAIIFVFGAVWLFTTYTPTNPLWLNILVVTTGSIMTGLSLLTFFIYSNYLFNHHITSLTYNSEHNSVAINGNFVDKNAINEVKWHKMKNKRLLAIWSSFEYLEIFFQDGNRLIISSLLLNPKYLNKFLERFPLTFSFSNFPVIKKS